MSDDLIEELNGISRQHNVGRKKRILELFGDRPEILDAIKRARVERGATMEALCQIVNKHSTEKISASSIRAWLLEEGCW